MAKPFELYPHLGIDLAGFKEEPWETLLVQYDCELKLKLELEPNLEPNLKAGMEE